jgi:type II secretory pathway pseudopilin PulG
MLNFKRLTIGCFSNNLIRGTLQSYSGILKKVNNHSGTTIVEVIVGMVILAMLVAGLNAGVISLVNTNKASKEIAAASNFGYEKLEEMRRDNYSNIELELGLQEGIYLIDRYVTEDAGLTQKSVKLDIRWPASVQNPRHFISLSTIIAKP